MTANFKYISCIRISHIPKHDDAYCDLLQLFQMAVNDIGPVADLNVLRDARKIPDPNDDDTIAFLYLHSNEKHSKCIRLFNNIWFKGKQLC